MRIVILGCLLLSAAACDATSPSVPSATESLRLTVAVSQSVLQPGDVATLTFRLENGGSESVTLQFPSSCQIKPYIATVSGTVIYPGGGEWGCAQVITTLTLAPGDSKEERLRIASQLQQLSSVYSLPAGDYVAYGRVDGSSALQSAPVAFSVR